MVFLVALSACGGGGGPSTPNQRPSAVAGPDMTVYEGDSVRLAGSGSDMDGTVSSFGWVQTMGPSVDILNADSSNATFVAPEVDASTVVAFRLTVTDDDGATAADDVRVTVNPLEPPTAGFSADVVSGEIPLRVSFTDESAPGTRPISEYRWSFGDGMSSSVPHPVHTYTEPGTYTVTLSVTSAAGSDGETKADFINAYGAEPTRWVRGFFEDAATFKNLCQVPRPDSVDRRGTTLDENNWLRSWSNDTYLWYDEIEDRDPACCATPAYFDLLRTTAKTPSGRDRDRFHFTYDTAEWIALSQSGVSAGYGAQFVVLEGRPPRDIRVAYTEPNTPATVPRVALMRGTRILEVDGVDVRAGNDVDTLNAGLFPDAGETHEFLVQDPGGEPRSVVMEAAVITQDPVQHIRLLSTATGPVGYLLFNDHIATAEAQLVDAMQSFQTAAITDLVLDLRYNGGGRLSIANRLAAMIAGAAAQGQTFEELQFNDKHRAFNPVTGRRLEPYLFESTSSDGARLPMLDLERLFVLTGPRTCSASEAIVNGLRGIDLDVVLIGDTTCGKPYGFYATDNCGTTYFTIQIKGVNAKGFGDFTDGFSPANALGPKGTEVPGCAVFDDFDHQFGDPEEARLQAALQYRIDGECPAPSGRVADTDAAADTPALATGGRSVRQPTPIGLKVLDW